LPPATALDLITLPLALWIAFKLPQVAGDHHSLRPVLAVNVACLLATLALLIVALSM